VLAIGLGDVDNAFKALGMDTGMIGQFAPLLLQYLGQQGIAGALLQNLGVCGQRLPRQRYRRYDWIARKYLLP